MAKYDVEFSCGHVEEMQLYGKHKDRERRIAWYKEYGLCKACYEAQQIAGIEEFEAKYDLPQLDGTEKQVRWARKIRKDVIAEIKEKRAEQLEREKNNANWEKLLVEANGRFKTVDELKEFIDGCVQDWKKCVAEGLKTEKACQAKFWIDNRDEYWATIENELKKMGKRGVE